MVGFCSCRLDFEATAKDVGYPVVDDKDFNSFQVPLPPLPEQERIAAYLDARCAAIIASLLKAKLPDRVVIVIAPKIVGKGVEAVGDLKIQSMDESLRLTYRKIRRLGNDLIIDARIEK